ncbi:NADP-dependent malic enzyme [uncultured Tissierella sp.]|uniref:NAD(P)-dependent malic enzyme n=1 Tax=uncultured Tissierella sp. TaxID=448160 RepID=UPI002804EA82|nr:NADP-dependent malic enzyme [uncultured Tissierella sp.]MDU5083101.1 NADP-dependent malic enzyme [Bacillota bacterium]
MDLKKESLELHKGNRGKLEIKSKVQIKDYKDLSIAYSPGVAAPCTEIKGNLDLVYEYTNKGNMVAVVTDGSAVLGLGNIGAQAGLPVMEGKAILFKTFADIDAIPICLKSQEIEDIISTVKNISPTFGGINLEDISAPRCFEIEERLRKELDIPVFHDDQHGTAVVVLAAIINSLKIVDKKKDNISIVINGAGAAGISIAKLLMEDGFKNIIICNRKGILEYDDSSLDRYKKEIAKITNPKKVKGGLKKALRNADIFIGVSTSNILVKEDIENMNKDPIVLAMANPNPEIMPEDAKIAGARIIGTGRSDYPNQVNNVLAFPGIFKGALNVRARDINEEMKLAAAYAISSAIKEEELNEENILPNIFDKTVVDKIAKAVSKAAKETGMARI